MTIPGERWCLEKIEGGFVLMHSADGEEAVATRIDWVPNFAPGLREAIAWEIVELRELARQTAIWIKN